MIVDSDHLLRDGTTNLDGTENGDGVQVGAAPLHNTSIFIYVPSAGTTFTVKFQESSDDGDADAYADVAHIASKTITAAGMYKIRAFWEEAYLRHVVTACTGNFGGVKIGVVEGAEPYP